MMIDTLPNLIFEWSHFKNKHVYFCRYFHRIRYMYVMMTMKIMKLIVDFEIYCHLNEYLQHADSCCSIKSQWNSLDKTLWIFFIVVAFSQLWRRVVAKNLLAFNWCVVPSLFSQTQHFQLYSIFQWKKYCLLIWSFLTI